MLSVLDSPRSTRSLGAISAHAKAFHFPTLAPETRLLSVAARSCRFLFWAPLLQSRGTEPWGAVPSRAASCRPDLIAYGIRPAHQRPSPAPDAAWAPTEETFSAPASTRKTLKARIAAGTFRLAEEFPDYVRRHVKEMPLALTFCDEVLTRSLHTETARVARGDLAHSTLESHRQILNYTWRPARSATARFCQCATRSFSTLQMLKPGGRKRQQRKSALWRQAFPEIGFKIDPEARPIPLQMMWVPALKARIAAHIFFFPSLFLCSTSTSLEDFQG